MRLILIRHAEAERSGPSDGPKAPRDHGLTAVGRRQAEELSVRLRARPDIASANVLLRSPSPRAEQTASAISTSLPAATIREVEDLCEIRDLPAPRCESFGPEGEMFEDFRVRVHATLHRLADQYAHADPLVAVTHAGFIVLSVLALFDIPRPGTGARLDPHYASTTEWHFEDGIWRLVRYNA